jgi:hypothetical protein
MLNIIGYYSGFNSIVSGAAAPDIFRRRQPAFGGALSALRRAIIFAAAASYNFGGEFGASNNYLIIKNLLIQFS